MKAITYLIHLERPLAHSQHYIGSTENDLDERIQSHKNTTWERYPIATTTLDGRKVTGRTIGSGSTFMGAVNAAGISWQVVRTWDGGRRIERWLKGWKKGSLLCPICNPNHTYAKKQRKRKE